MKRILESELMVDKVQCENYNYQQEDIASYDSFYIDLYKKYCGIESGTVIDLGCGPANHLVRLAKEFPNLSIVGYDASDEMIAIARKNIASIPNLCVECKWFSEIDHTADVVISLQALHHQHNPKLFWEIVNKLSTSFVFIVDLERPTSIAGISCRNPDIEIDVKNSFAAAFTKDEVIEQTTLTVESLPLLHAGAPTRFNRLVIYGHQNT